MSISKKFFIVILLLFNSSAFAFDEFLVSDIRIIGLQRVSTGSIFNVIPISVGDKINQRKSRDFAISSVSLAFFIKPNESLNHCIAAPAIKTLPSKA